MTIRIATLLLATLLTACGPKAPLLVDPTSDKTVAERPGTRVPASPDKVGADSLGPSAPPTNASPLPELSAPVVLAPPDTSPSAVAILDGRVGLAINDASRPGHSAIQVIDLETAPIGASKTHLTVPGPLLPPSLGIDWTTLRFADSGMVLGALGQVIEDGKTSDRWVVHAWRREFPETAGKDTPKWVSIFAHTFKSSDTPILVMPIFGDKLILAGSRATAWALPELPLTGRVTAKPKPILEMPEDSGWWLPDSSAYGDDLAFRIINNDGQVLGKTHLILPGVFTQEGASSPTDDARPLPIDVFSNASVRAMGGTLSAVPLDPSLNPILLTLQAEAVEPHPARMSSGTSILDVGTNGEVLLVDGFPPGLYVLRPGLREFRLAEEFASATMGAITDNRAVVALSDGSVHLVPFPTLDTPVKWTALTDTSALPAAFRPLFSKAGFRLEGHIITTSYDDESGAEKDSRKSLRGQCVSTRLESSGDVFYSEVTCSGLSSGYVTDFSGHWYAIGEHLHYRDTFTEDLVALRRSVTTILSDGGCLIDRQGYSHPETIERCLDEKGPSKVSFEGGSAAHNVVLELTRVK
jgi:hypothetical protein